jgi:hypothetical protein
VEWDNFDVLSPESIKIEVKASGYRQSWPQTQCSEPRFGGFRAAEWNWEEARYIGAPVVRADVFVFAIQTCRDDALYDVLDVRQWQFFVVPAGIVRDHAGNSVGMGFLTKYGGTPVGVDRLHEAIRLAAGHALEE